MNTPKKGIYIYIWCLQEAHLGFEYTQNQNEKEKGIPGKWKQKEAGIAILT